MFNILGGWKSRVDRRIGDLDRLLHELDDPRTADADTCRQVIDQLDLLLVRAQDAHRRASAREARNPLVIHNADGSLESGRSIMSPTAPWLSMPYSNYDVPSMIANEEKAYYNYIGGFYKGLGHVIELGPWLGSSTLHILDGLSNSHRFDDRKLYVFDDFVWRTDWMDQYVSAEERLPHHACFRHLFDKYTEAVKDRMEVERIKLTDYDGNESLEQFSWSGEPVEFVFADCGRSMETNQFWFRKLEGSLIPGQSLLILQDWRTHREVPRLWYNQMLQFTQSLADRLQLVHEVSDGGVATFLFIR